MAISRVAALKYGIPKARMCHEHAVAARKLADGAPTLAEREAGRTAEQQWLRFARLYELMDKMFASLDPAEAQQHDRTRRVGMQRGPVEPRPSEGVRDSYLRFGFP